MDSFIPFLTTALGVLLRLGIPIAVTILMVMLLRRLDERWQREAQSSGAYGQARNTGCWKVHNCPEERLARCSAYTHQDVPCWQHFRSKEGKLQERCIGCKVFKEAPIPVPV